MPADTFTTSNPKSLVVQWEITIGGAPVPTEWELVSINTKKEVGKIATSTVKFTETMPWDAGAAVAGIQDDSLLKPGEPMVIKVGTVTSKKVIFDGVVSEIGIGSLTMNGTSIDITGKDKSEGMTVDRQNKHFQEQTDSQIMSDIITKHGLKVGEIESTSYVHEDLPQFDSTDWDFLLARADFYGFVVKVVDGEVSIKKPEVSGPQAVYTYGVDISDMKLDVKSKDQVKEFKAFAWNHDEQKIDDAVSSEPSVNDMGRYSGLDLAKTNGNRTHRLYHSGNIAKSQLKDWVDGQLMRNRLARIKGTVTVDGNFDLEPDGLVTLQGISSEVDGDGYISAIEHNIGQGDWNTTIHLGLETDSSTQSNTGDSVHTPTASGQVPGVGNGNLQIAKVVKIHSDPLKQFRIQLSVPLIGKPDEDPNAQSPEGDTGEYVWARILQQQASNKTGFYNLPEEGDEVLITYVNGDPRNPVIMGSVYSKKMPMPVDPDDGGEFEGKQSENNIKGFYSREGLRMRFQEVDKIIMIDTPAGNVITMTEKDKKIIIEDENKNKIEMHPEGIDIYTPKDLKVLADKNISVEAGIDISFKAGMNFSVEATNVSTKADLSNKMEGTTSEVKGSATTTIKGGMVMIN